MIKVIPPDAWDFGAPPLELVKVAACGLSGTDLKAFVKRAGHPLALWVRDNPPGKGGAYVHAIAMGSTEVAGPNRNSEGYPNDMLKRDHLTFEKYAKWYRAHRNQDPRKSYGTVKRAWHNPELQRVELICELNTTKEAAERNNGLIADKELDALEAGHDIAVSQSVKVSHDLCSACGHKARHRGEYCSPEQCVKYGGCRDNLGRIYDDGFHLFVQNPVGSFFDISNVSDTRGADRTAFVTGKVASNPERVPGGAELAELLGLVPPDHLLEPASLSAVGALRKLAAAGPYQHPVCSWADAAAGRAGAPVAFMATAPHATLAALAASGVVLPPAEWLALTSGVARDKCAAAFAGGFDVGRDLLSRPDAHELVADSSLSLSGHAPSFARLAPSVEHHARESALAVIKAAGAPRYPAIEPAPAAVRAEAKARYLAYAGWVLGAHEKSAIFPLLLTEARRHISAHVS